MRDKSATLFAQTTGTKTACVCQLFNWIPQFLTQALPS